MSRSLRALWLSVCGASLLLLGGCGEEGPPTGATCPTDNTLTAANFGTDFMNRYCNRCHASGVSGLARAGAPTDVNFDTLEGVRREAANIDRWSGASDTVTNTSMPPGGTSPSVEERRKLSQWLACGAP